MIQNQVQNRLKMLNLIFLFFHNVKFNCLINHIFKLIVEIVDLILRIINYSFKS